MQEKGNMKHANGIHFPRFARARATVRLVELKQTYKIPTTAIDN